MVASAPRARGVVDRHQRHDEDHLEGAYAFAEVRERLLFGVPDLVDRECAEFAIPTQSIRVGDATVRSAPGSREAAQRSLTCAHGSVGRAWYKPQEQGAQS